MLKPVKKSMLELHPKEEDAEKDPLAMDQFEKVGVYWTLLGMSLLMFTTRYWWR